MTVNLPFNFSMTPKQARLRGVLLVIIGFFLVALIGTVSAVIFDVIPISTFFPGAYRDPNAGPATFPLAAWAFLGYFAVFGVVIIVQGIWQIAFGVRNKLLTILIIVMAIGLIGAGMIARALK